MHDPAGTKEIPGKIIQPDKNMFILNDNPFVFIVEEKGGTVEHVRKIYLSFILSNPL